MTIPDWQLPPGVDRGLWDYLHADDMVRGYDDAMAAAPLARADVAFCGRHFPTPGRLIDLGCGTGRLCLHFAARGFDCVGVDLSDEMLARARANAAAALGGPTPSSPVPAREGGDGAAYGTRTPVTDTRTGGTPGSPPSRAGTGDVGVGSGVRGSVTFTRGNLVDLAGLPAGSFDYAACLFSTLGMVRGADNRAAVAANAFRLLKPGGRLVLHVHNRFFRGLGWGRVARHALGWPLGRGGDVTMSQAYGGAPLTLHHFTRRGAARLLTDAGFAVTAVEAVGVDGAPRRLPWNAYGYLLLAERPG